MSQKLESSCSLHIPSKRLVSFYAFPIISQDPIKHIAFPKHLHVTGPNSKVPAVLACPKHAILKGVLFKNRLKRDLQIPPTQQFLCAEQIGGTAVNFSDLWSEACSLGATYLNTPSCFSIRDERGWEDNIT